jgi:hypothetical protein
MTSTDQPMSLTFSLAEQNFSWTRSIGLLNLSMRMLEHLARRPEVARLTLLSNDTFRGALSLPERVRVCTHNEANGRGLSRIWWDQWKVYSAAQAAGNAWLFMPKGFVSFVRRCPVKLCVYIPDVMFITYYEKRCPGSFGRLELRYLKWSLRAALRQARVAFTCSEFTNREIEAVCREWGLTPPRLVAVGVGFTPAQKASGPKADRVVVLASTYRHKRTDLAVEYLRRWQEATNFAGHVDWVGHLPPGLGLPAFPRWHHHLRVPEAEYRRMVADARALVYFTECEGFGMPPVEAITAGTCAVYSEIEATREVMRSTGCSFRNDAYESFAAALVRALQTTPEELRSWEAELLARHNWDRGAERIVRALQEADAT